MPQKAQNTLSGTGNGGGSIPSPDVARYILWEAVPNESLDNFLATNDVIGGNGGVFTVPPTANSNPALRMQSQEAANDFVEGAAQIWPDRRVTFKTACYAGYYTLPDFAGPAVTAALGIVDGGLADGCWFGFVKNAGADTISNWIFQCSSGGVVTAVDTGIPVSPGAVPSNTSPIVNGHRYELEFTLENGVATALIDGEIAAVINTNIPTGVVLFPYLIIATSATPAGNAYLTVEYVYVENATP
jgi:hypothetical protein